MFKLIIKENKVKFKKNKYKLIIQENKLNENIEVNGNFDGITFDQNKGMGSTHYNKSLQETGIVVMMHPDDFLSLTPPFSEKREIADEKVKSLISAIRDGNSVASPWLSITEENVLNGIKIKGHEGRHRATAIKSINPNIKIPVIIEYESSGYDNESVESIIGKINLIITTENNKRIQLKNKITEYYLLGQTKKINMNILDTSLESQMEALKNIELLPVIEDYTRKTKMDFIKSNLIKEPAIENVEVRAGAEPSKDLREVEAFYELSITFKPIFANFFNVKSNEQIDADLYDKYYEYLSSIGKKLSNEVTEKVLKPKNSKYHQYFVGKDAGKIVLYDNGSISYDMQFFSKTTLFLQDRTRTNAEEIHLNDDLINFSRSNKSIFIEIIKFVNSFITKIELK